MVNIAAIKMVMMWGCFMKLGLPPCLHLRILGGSCVGKCSIHEASGVGCSRRETTKPGDAYSTAHHMV